MHAPLARPDYYEASAPPAAISRHRACPPPRWKRDGKGRPRTVPTFTAHRSARPAPSYTPAASPRLRRRLSARPPHRLLEPATELTRLLGSGHVLHPGPYPPDWSRAAPLRGFHHWFTRVTPSDLASRTRAVWQYQPVPTLSRLLPPSPAIPGSGCLQLHPTAATARRRSPSISARIRSASWRTEELVPVGGVAGQPGAFQAEHDPGPAQGDLGDQVLEPFPVGCAGAGLALVDVDHGDLVRRPAQRDRLAAQVVLADRGFGVVDDLLEAGLADVFSELKMIMKSRWRPVS